ncbi:hypothetical protein PsorP6_002252 [Peronosclerospora sorghi]|uniref:Uncharacterized protein n=1 Tax=Peronosclerospora sorghi TaxID=230839 RepID=A0ACC0WWJ5_9STRA|nr:hypothetical protein PsorP6_002252 [Peronosclerospora sorghi]
MSGLAGQVLSSNSTASDTLRQERKRATKVERARQKALDQQYVNNTKLRAERLTRSESKIGYEITLKLLRSGAMVVAMTRFPKDAEFRYVIEKYFEVWKYRPQIYGMDFRDLGIIDRFMDHI